MTNLFKYLIIVFLITGCKTNKIAINRNLSNQNEMIVLGEININVKNCEKTFESFKNSTNYIDVFFYEYFQKSNTVNATRIIKIKQDDEIRMYSIIDDKSVEKEISEKIRNQVLNFTDSGNYMIFQNKEILSYNINILYYKKNGKMTFTLHNFDGEKTLKQQDIEKIDQGIILLKLLK